MEACLDNSAAKRLEQTLLSGLSCVVVLLVVTGWAMYASYPGVLPNWTSFSLSVVVWGDAACFLASIVGIFLTTKKSKFVGYAVLALVLLPVTAFLRNGDHVVTKSHYVPYQKGRCYITAGGRAMLVRCSPSLSTTAIILL